MSECLCRCNVMHTQETGLVACHCGLSCRNSHAAQSETSCTMRPGLASATLLKSGKPFPFHFQQRVQQLIGHAGWALSCCLGVSLMRCRSRQKGVTTSSTRPDSQDEGHLGAASSESAALRSTLGTACSCLTMWVPTLPLHMTTPSQGHPTHPHTFLQLPNTISHVTESVVQDWGSFWPCD